MKKKISILLLMVVLLNFIFSNCVLAAIEDDIGSDEDVMSGSDIEAYISESTVTYNGETTSVDFDSMGSGIFGTISALIARAINLFPWLIKGLMTLFVGDSFTIEEAVFGQYEVFNINYFESSSNEIVSALRSSVAEWYYILRMIAMVISLPVLMYVGIRMALSTMAGDKAKYKKMLIAWFESIILLFLMQYIMALVFYVGDKFNDVIISIRNSVISSSSSFETIILANVNSLFGLKGWTFVAYSIVFWFLVGIQLKYFWLYLKRVIAVGFLIVIAPLVTITYPIDKIGDGRAQAFRAWLNEFIMNVVIQPIHAMIYLVFMFTAGEIASYSVWIGLAFLLCLGKIEQMVLKLFSLRNMGTLKPLDQQRGKQK